MVDVFLTVDTELSFPLTPSWREKQLAFEIDRDIHGRTADGDFGIGFQMEKLNENGLKGIFFVEGLSGSAAGRKPLETIVALVQEGGHEVQLHLHTQWLPLMETSPVGAKTGRHIRHFTREEQARLLALAASNLTACGAAPVRAFRAGSFGANWDTLRALRDVGIEFDSSLNESAFGRSCELQTPTPVTQPTVLEGVVEFPVTVFHVGGGLGTPRPLQICACSFSEMKEALEDAWRSGWRAVTIVSHGFELVKRPGKAGELGQRSRIRARRFEDLCCFLGAHRDRFRTCGFTDWNGAIANAAPCAPLQVPVRKSAWRLVEQAADRFV